MLFAIEVNPMFGIKRLTLVNIELSRRRSSLLNSMFIAKWRICEQIQFESNTNNGYQVIIISISTLILRNEFEYYCTCTIEKVHESLAYP
ncbi:hypothetical protein ACVLD2_004073 [Paenibacillus sp. PvR052]|nr:hypothetical protein [Paenibacillus sp. PvP091]MBP1170625.1 hypothetical protein [Paenibacillus sp. PvR098]MBP2441653.1 hypothetical protein [Paenibacillus sp. PvP052]